MAGSSRKGMSPLYRGIITVVLLAFSLFMASIYIQYSNMTGSPFIHPELLEK